MSGESVKAKCLQCFLVFSLSLVSLSFNQKDTVFIPLWVSGGSRHVQQHQSGIVGFVDDDLVELDSSVHPPDVGVVPVREERCI